LNIFGFSITRQKDVAGAYPVTAGSGGWWNIIRESFPTAWQRNIEVNVDNVLNSTAVFACISLISSDISKLRLRLVAQDPNGIWIEVDGNSPFWPVLRKPNRYQTTQQFVANWLESKLIHGNTYILKAYDARRVVTQMYVLNPRRVTVLCAPDGSVYYELRSDHLTGLSDEVITVPASDIMHDRWNTFRHPLVGTSPLAAAGMSAVQGLRIQENSAKFFANGANPGGVLSAPGFINEETAARLKDYWDANYGSGGANVGKVAVLGDGLQYTPVTMSAVDADLVEQARMTAETVCSAFHVPKYMIGIGDPPTYNNIEALNQYYYSQCLQVLIEDIEKLLDEGLNLPRDPVGRQLGTEFDTDSGLFRMDTQTRANVAQVAVRSGLLSPNEGRNRYFDLPPVKGGDSPMMQQQQFSLEALAERDEAKPFARPASPLASAPAESPANGSEPSPDDDEEERSINVVNLARFRERVTADTIFKSVEVHGRIG
jgi:HK97 family phage portal protein